MNALRDRVGDHVRRIWGDSAASDLTDRLLDAIGVRDHASEPPSARWDERDVVLITYGDSVTGAAAPLVELTSFVTDQLLDSFGMVHVLPFAPSSSDRGFAVIDYTAVNPALGTWADLDALTERVDLMADLVLNHVSTRSRWFEQFLADEEPGRRYIKTAEPDADLSLVVRPRSLPLRHEFATAAGPKTVWTTFSPDQADLDWSEPDLAIEMMRVVDLYLRHGARFLRLDAVAYVWKEPGTTCIHHPRTHEIVRLLRTLLEVRAPAAVLITETNVPDAENRSYLGAGDEAHVVYNFTLPPLLVDGILNGRADRLADFIAGMPTLPAGTTMFNFVASHDGIGLRPAEGVLSPEEIDGLVRRTEERGGLHGTYDVGGSTRPYEINIALPDLFGGSDDPLMPSRVLLAHTIMLTLAGLPAIYINSLVGTTNDLDAVRADGIRRSINRGSVAGADLPPEEPAWRRDVYRGLLDRAAVRRRHTAFHPDGAQSARRDGPLLRVLRTSPDDRSSIELIANLGDGEVATPADAYGSDLVSGEAVPAVLGPYAAVWLDRSVASD